jgi:hypothetical protein
VLIVEDGFGLAGVLGDAGGEVPPPCCGVRAAQGEPESALTLPQRLLGQPAGGDVARNGDRADDLSVLVKVGGWAPDAIARAARELETLILGYLKGYTELHEVEEITSDRIRGYLQERVQESKRLLGLEVITLTIASFDPVDPQIAEALRQREHARILEQTEISNQQARVAATRVRLQAEDEIAVLEHALEIRKYELKQAEFEKESALAGSRSEHELRLKKMQLDFEKDELRMLKDSPELLLLTPQAARLAEASQSMRNARTVVSLSPPDGVQGTEILSMFRTLVQKALGALSARKKK